MFSNIAITRLYVVGCDDHTKSVSNEPDIKIGIEQISDIDADLIDELSKQDVWNISKESTLAELKKGEIGYIARNEGKIVATWWTLFDSVFHDYYLNRDFTLAPDEAYHWRIWTVREYRGKGIVPQLSTHILEDISCRHHKSHHLCFVRTNNESMLNALSKTGWRRIGCAGMVEVGRVRFHYLWGREAFPMTKKRIYMTLH